MTGYLQADKFWKSYLEKITLIQLHKKFAIGNLTG